MIGQHTAVGDVATARKLFGNRDSWSPQGSGWKYWTNDPISNFQGFAGFNGVVSLSTIEVTEDDSITNIIYDIYTAGSGGTSGQCLVGLYQNGVRLGVSATQHTAFASTGVKTAALASGPIAVAKGFVQVAFLPNGGTAPVFGCPIGWVSGVSNAALTAYNGLPRGGYKTTGSQTSMPTPLGAMTAGGAPWAALS
jgi:hypothetical protein